MKFNLWYPFANEMVWFSLRTFKRLKDKCCTSGEAKTKSTTIQQYVDIHSGPLYYMHYKYSSMMNITFITFMFGAGIPVLFPLAAAAFFVLYFLEVYMLYYIYKEPPSYDEKLNESVLKNMTKAPALLLGFGYWMLSNH